MTKNSRTSHSSAVLEDSTLPASGRDSGQSSSVKMSRSARAYLKSIGQKSPSSPTSETSMERNGKAQPFLPEGLHVRGQALLPLFKENEQEKLSGQKWQELLKKHSQVGLLLNSLPVTKNGKIKLRYLWRKLAIVLPDLNDRLQIVVRLINEGVCSLLPTPVASDSTRSPGSEKHPRLKKNRGLRLPEELGARPGPEIVEWMMGYPIGWTDSKPSVTQSSPKSHSKS